VPDFITKPYVLAFDAAMSGCSVALLNASTGESVSEMRRMIRGQSEILVPMVQNVLTRSGRIFADIGLIVTTIGPGAFTGLRIGLSAARSFGLSLNIPVAGVTTTEAIALMAREKTSSINKIIVVLETKREDLYMQDGSDDPIAIDREHILLKYKENDATFCGDGVSRLKRELGDAWPSQWLVQDGMDLPDPSVIARIGYKDFKIGKMRPATPLYLRGADVSQSSRPTRVIAWE
jgi:tRNA threonylcarbamoyladenosine biosynthesis protein TsaB